MGAGGPVSVKLPTVAADSFDFSKMKAQAASLLGNPKIPSIPFGSTNAGVVTSYNSENLQKVDKLVADINAETDKQTDLRNAYNSSKETSGPDSDATAAAYTAWQDSSKKVASLTKELGDMSA
jgi:hypothetical protein